MSEPQEKITMTDLIRSNTQLDFIARIFEKNINKIIKIYIEKDYVFRWAFRSVTDEDIKFSSQTTQQYLMRYHEMSSDNSEHS